MPVAIVTGAGGPVGAESCPRLCGQRLDVPGAGDDLRTWFFGPSASTAAQTRRLEENAGSRPAAKAPGAP